jgi:glycogen debranching enzyme
LALTILEGSTFCICDELGDISERTGGFFAEDTRFLSLFRLTMNGEKPLLLSSGTVEHYSAAFYLRNPLADGLPQDSLAIVRERRVADDMHDRIVVQNVSAAPVSFELAVEVASDFADIFAVKEHDFSFGDPIDAKPLPDPVEPRLDAGALLLVDAAPGGATTHIHFSELGDVDGGVVRYRLELGPRERWELATVVNPRTNGRAPAPQHLEEQPWKAQLPRLVATWDPLHHSFERSLADLAALRMRGGSAGHARLPAAGMPWFMTVFGRDTLVTSYQTLLLGPELARGALEVLAELQATEDDPSIDAEPGKIVHEVRHGKAAKTWFRRYYGTVDATPLYLVLLSEVWRWTGDDELVRQLREPALGALGWIDSRCSAGLGGFISYERRTERGLENQSWKDSGDSQRFADGRIAAPPIAPVEVQGYAYDAKRRVAELAREVWGEPELAERLETEAADLQQRFDEAFWTGEYYALALDGEGARVDSLCSNVGHLLWSGIVPEERVDAVVAALMGVGLWSGWGVRTMSANAAAYNPLSYHNGTVWPHDNSLIAAGLARYGRWEESGRIVRAMLEAAAFLDHELPEVFAGLPRGETPFPIAYPTAARPQAWAAGTPVLLLQLLLGLRPEGGKLVTAGPPVPEWAGSLRLSGVRAFDRSWDVRLEDGRVIVE